MSEQETPTSQFEKLAVRIARWLLLWLRRLVLVFLLLFMISYLALQIPFVQTWAARQVTSFLSKELHTTVRIDRLSIAFFDQLVLRGFYMEDQAGDTLLYSRLLKANLNTNLVKLLQSSLEIDELTLNNARVILRRDSGEFYNNFQFIVDYFQRDTSILDPNPDLKKPFYLNIKALYLDDVGFENTDKVRGHRLFTYIRQGVVLLNEMNLPDKRIDVKVVELNSPVIILEDREGTTLPWSQDSIFYQFELPDTLLAQMQDTTSAYIAVQNFLMHNGRFEFHNYRRSPEKLTPTEILDYDHVEVFDINMDIRGIITENGVLKGHVEHIDLQDMSGFDLQELAVDNLIMTSRRAELNGLRIKTPYTTIGDTLIFNYKELADWSDFNNKISMDIRLHNAQVAVSDIMVFAPPLEKNAFFKNNEDKIIHIDGSVRGEVNNLRGIDLNLRLNGNTELKGNFSSRNLAVRNEEFLNLRLDWLRTNARTIQQLFPTLNLPSNVNQLGNLFFRGRFDGFFVDFVADGSLQTQIGRAQLDMRMNLKPGRERAQYSGKISLIDFDLGKWTGNSEFGKVTLTSAVENGKGLTESTADAKLSANIKSFVFRGYNYENATMKGELKQKFFNGYFAIQDDNIDFTFQGEVDYSDSIPIFDFNATVTTLALKPLNLAKKDLILSGDLELRLRDDKLSTLEGRAEACNFTIRERGKEAHHIDSLILTSNFTAPGEKSFRIESDLMQVKIDGEFDIEEIPNALLQFAHRNFPGFSQRFGLQHPQKPVNPSRFTFDIDLLNTKGLTRLFTTRLDTLSNIELDGYFNNYTDSLDLEAHIPRLKFDNIEIFDGAILSEITRSEGKIDLAIYKTIINDKQELAPISALSILNQDTMEFGLNYASRGQSVLDLLNLNGTFFLLDSTQTELRFSNSNLMLLETSWNINENNFLRFGNNKIEVTDFRLQDRRGRQIILDDVQQQGLALSLQDFDFNFIDEYWDYDALNFKGKFDLNAKVNDIFKLTGLSAELTSDTVFINDDDFGDLRFTARAGDIHDRATASLALTKGSTRLTAEGTYQLPAAAENQSTKKGENAQDNYFNFNVSLNRYPLDIAEYFLAGAISNTKGYINANFTLDGLPSKPNINGEATIFNGAITIDYLNTRYSIHNQKIKISNTIFDASGGVITDKYSNTATVQGGITHDHLRNFALNATLITDRFLALDTQKGDNNLFYGQAIGTGTVRFTGPFNQTNIDVKATTGAGTRIVIPVSYEQEATEVRFIRFNDPNRDEEDRQSISTEIRGLKLDMEITATEEAEMLIIFDEKAGDIIQGRGRGNIQLYISRTGDMTMYGDYEIEQGEYLFTLLNLVNKPFTVQRGGTIRWTGDPLNAQLNLIAEYKGLSTSVSNFIQEYLSLANAETQSAASQPTDVELTMRLQGELTQPIINFNLAFPEVQGSLKTYTDSKLRTLIQDQNELNRQVFGLIVVGQFLPSNFTLQGSELTINTVSELVANQLSILFTEFFSELVTDVNFISGIDFDISYNRYENQINLNSGADNQFYYGNEFQLRLKNYLFNDKLSISLGGNVASGTTSGNVGDNSTFFGNDFVLEYVLTKDRSLKWRVYQKLEPSLAGGRRLQIGTGVSYRKEFDSFQEFISKILLNKKSSGKK